MFGLFRKPDHVAIAAGVPRSPKWPAWLKKFLVGKSCIVCGAKDGLTGHHVVPFHVDPSRELDASNVEPVCDGDCHFVVGHFKDWRIWNRQFREDAASIFKRRREAQAARNIE